MTRLRRAGTLALLLPTFALVTGCTTLVVAAAMPFLYEEASLPAARTELDLAYRNVEGADPDKLRFDWFEPEGSAWKTVVFVHGGGWRHGDRAQEAGGADVYRNIGRYLASHGVAAGVISYRLQPDVAWTEQVADVRHAVRAIRDKARRSGGDPSAIFLSGHSAGAHLSAVAGTDAAGLEAVGVPAASICGLIPVSGAALDLNDPESWSLGQSEAYYAARFGTSAPTETWRSAASVTPRIGKHSPPALILYAGGESAVLIRQAHALHERYQAVGASSRLLEVPGEDHQRIVLTLSRDDKTAGPAMLDFVRSTECDGQ